jgi:hypothetical protein
MSSESTKATIAKNTRAIIGVIAISVLFITNELGPIPSKGDMKIFVKFFIHSIKTCVLFGIKTDISILKTNKVSIKVVAA